MEHELHKLRIDKTHRATRERKPVWPIALAVVLLLLVLLAAIQWHGHTPSFVVKTLRVHVPEVTKEASDLVSLNATGYVTAAHKIELASKVVGKVAWVGVEMGDKIQKDQELVRLENEEYKARVAEQEGLLDNAKAKLAELLAGSRPQEIAQAQAMLDQADSELANAQLNLDRMHAMEGTHSVSQQQIDDAEALVKSRKALAESQKQTLDLAKAGPRKEQIDAQRATVRQLEGSLALATVDLNDTVIRAPFAATVLDRNVEVGEFVTTGFVGDKGAKGYVLSIADLNDLRVELDISQNDIAKASAGQPCWITTDAYPDHKYSGVVELISPEANRQKATVLVRVTVLKPDDLIKPDMNATVTFFSHNTSTSQPAVAGKIRVPSNAIRDQSVFVVEDGKALKKPITPGLTTAGGETEIQKGLIGGEDLILNPPDQLKDGDKVAVE
ncbi:MAG TPA: efflux RND transporter periplasmic adaptor subunit [Tepidisphaeraceae bacterium]|nr:efflux RND transporter periplasmic adaptor subunit [Tepidisphaeraceae bacterium]